MPTFCTGGKKILNFIVLNNIMRKLKNKRRHSNKQAFGKPNKIKLTLTIYIKKGLLIPNTKLGSAYKKRPAKTFC